MEVKSVKKKKNGNYSRNKGRRGEYAIRDLLRNGGYSVDRVPLSGASQGFKGDLRISSGPYLETTKYMEIKCRKDAFKHIYKHLEDNGNAAESRIYTPKFLITISKNFTTLAMPESVDNIYTLLTDKTPARCLKLHTFLQDCDYLCIKDDRKEPLFLRFDKI